MGPRSVGHNFKKNNYTLCPHFFLFCYNLAAFSNKQISMGILSVVIDDCLSLAACFFSLYL